jgi:hypothetical protein
MRFLVTMQAWFKNGEKWRFIRGPKAPLFPSWERGLSTQVIDLAASTWAGFFGARGQEKCRAPFFGAEDGVRTRHSPAPVAAVPRVPTTQPPAHGRASYVGAHSGGRHQERLQSKAANSVSITTAHGAHLHGWLWSVPCRVTGTPVNGPTGATSVQDAGGKLPTLIFRSRQESGRSKRCRSATAQSTQFTYIIYSAQISSNFPPQSGRETRSEHLFFYRVR